jgi:chitinase
MLGLRRLRGLAVAAALAVPLTSAGALGTAAQAAPGTAGEAAPARAHAAPAGAAPAGAAAANAALPAAAGQHGHRRYERVGYFTQWGIYGADFRIKNLVTNGTAGKLTVLNYAFGNVTKEGVCTEASAPPGLADPWADYQVGFTAEQNVDGVADTDTQPLAGNFNQIRELKKRYPRLRAQISLGGWTWSDNFSDAALTPASRRKFVASCIDLYLKGNLPREGNRGGPGTGAGVFDGIDLDWEWPGSAGEPGNVVRPEDKPNFTLLVAEFRRQLDELGRQNRRHYSLTAFLPADPTAIEAGFEVAKLRRYFDYVTLQGYDLHGPWDLTTNHQSALFVPRGDPTSEGFSVDQTVREYLRRGMPAHKLVLGVPFYGHGWTGVPDVNHGLFQKGTGPAPGSAAEGYEDYKRLKALPGFRVHRDLRAGFAWLYDGKTFWTYDDPLVMYQKSAYIRWKGLGGVMAWSLDADDGSLIRALDRGLS